MQLVPSKPSLTLSVAWSTLLASAEVIYGKKCSKLVSQRQCYPEQLRSSNVVHASNKKMHFRSVPTPLDVLVFQANASHTTQELAFDVSNCEQALLAVEKTSQSRV